MAHVLTTISSKGQLVIPVQLREALGIEPGTRFSIRLEGDELILRPQTPAATERLIQELCGMTAGGYSMADDLMAERRAEDAKADW